MLAGARKLKVEIAKSVHTLSWFRARWVCRWAGWRVVDVRMSIRSSRSGRRMEKGRNRVLRKSGRVSFLSVVRSRLLLATVSVV